MKQLIVMIATILLGIAIAVVVLGFSGTAETLASGVSSKTAEKVSLSSFGRSEQSLFDSFSGSIGTVRSTR